MCTGGFSLYAGRPVVEFVDERLHAVAVGHVREALDSYLLWAKGCGVLDMHELREYHQHNATEP